MEALIKRTVQSMSGRILITMKTKIIYEDEHIIIINKPSGLATQTARVGQPDVVSELKKYLSSKYLGIIHRLDQPVEGLLVFAKTKQAAAVLTRQFTSGSLHKKYYAVACGKATGKKGELVDYLLKGENQLARIVTGMEQEYQDAKKAVLQYKIIQNLSTPAELMLVDIHILTGRFHQIRAQMAHAGMPLLGDSKYGSEKAKEIAAREGIRNVALCAYELTLQHPVTKKSMFFTIEPENKAFSFFA